MQSGRNQPRSNFRRICWLLPHTLESVKTLPEGVDDRQLIHALAAGWNLNVEDLDYIAEGFGSYHWLAVDNAGGRHFVTVDDLDQKGWLGSRRETAFNGLRRAFDTAAVLRAQGYLDFVVAPVSSADGDTVARLGPRHTVAVFPYFDGEPTHFDQRLEPDERADVVHMLVELHQATSAVRAIAPHHRVELSARRHLDAALHQLGTTWKGGPLSEPARALLGAHRGGVIGLLATFDRLVAEVATKGGDHVITHGEPHAGNVMQVGEKLVLVDWDTVALAPPERDLCMVATDTGEELALYLDLTGRAVDQAAMSLYRARWPLDDIAWS